MVAKIPSFFEEILKKEYNENDINRIVEGLAKTRVTTLRINTLKASTEKIKSKFQNAGIQFECVAWNDTALIIKNATESEIKELDIYKNGEIYMQSLSSMIPPIIVNPQEKESILDMTAAPGGKTTEMAAISNNLAMITACEKNKIRCDRLKYNLEKQGATRVTVMQEDARKISDYFSFDKILLDAPCSGSGTINLKDDNLQNYFSEELVKRSINTQRELLSKATKIVKVGGEIIYSTCSILKEEDEEIIKEILKKPNFEIESIKNEQFKDIPLLPAMDGTICVCPTDLYEGFFVAKIRRIK